ncbi:hypothetical protein ACFL08_05335 [Patescibacteria group bacterium]
MKNQVSGLNKLIVLLLIFIGLAFVYPLFANDPYLGGIALLAGFVGGAITFGCIIAKVMGNKDEDEDSDSSTS